MATSEPGAVATGQRVNWKDDDFAKCFLKRSVWPVATAPGSDVVREITRKKRVHID